MSVRLRKRVIVLDEIRHEGGPPPETPRLRGAVLAVIANPFAGRHEPDIQPFMDELRPLGLAMADALLAALRVPADRIDGYGKGAIVGEDGELEHAALWHAPGGYSMRERLPRSAAIVPSTKKVGGPGTRLDVPITHSDASYVRSHFDAIEVGVPDAPRAGEMVVALAMTVGPRVHARSGGLAAEDVQGRDGLR